MSRSGLEPPIKECSERIGCAEGVAAEQSDASLYIWNAKPLENDKSGKP
jgi:hypothetical protein